MQNGILEAVGTQRNGKCAGLWSLDHTDEASTQEVMEDAIQHSENYVLKPQREGGGNNLYGQQLKERLRRQEEGLSAYILMQRIRPPIHQYVIACLSCCCAEDGKLQALEGAAPFCEDLRFLLLGVVKLIPSAHWTIIGCDRLHVVTQVTDGEGREAVSSGFSVGAGNIWHLPAARN